MERQSIIFRVNAKDFPSENRESITFSNVFLWDFLLPARVWRKLGSKAEDEVVAASLK